VYHKEGRLAQYGRELPPFSTVFFDLTQPPLQFGENDLAVELVGPVKGADDQQQVIIDEIDVTVVP
jgi:hypothetical protein